jgi:hypothetical protein
VEKGKGKRLGHRGPCKSKKDGHLFSLEHHDRFIM